MSETRDFNYVYDLDAIRSERRSDKKPPLAHQQDALDALHGWFDRPQRPHKGGLLVLPTGGGKTFTAVRFLCGSRSQGKGGEGPLSRGYKVLWMAHTHHLLEQAFEEFPASLQLIKAPRATLGLRVVSGARQHHRIQHIRPEDDVVIATLQTIHGAVEHGHRGFRAWLDSCAGRLFIVFDEAHHSPAPSYRRLIQSLLERHASAAVLGLTATPTYGNEARRPWLGQLFPQGIVHQEPVSKLMAAGILARPRPHQSLRTGVKAKFDVASFRRWVGTFGDLPEKVVTQLAKNGERNAFIAETYVSRRREFGQTIVFADRWYQCVQIVTALQKHGVRAGAIYSQREGGHDRERENQRILSEFRDGALDVIVNIRMLTEGTDVPMARTAFITRQTTSRILLTQMVGRVLRGPEVGGTDEAHLVFFVDDWQQHINWAEWELLEGLEPEPDGQLVAPAPVKSPVVEQISVDLLRQLLQWMEDKIGFSPVPFRDLLPIGWYQVEFEVLVDSESGDVTDLVKRLVLVFDRDRSGFERLIGTATPGELGPFADVVREADLIEDVVAMLQERHFSDEDLHGPNLAEGIEDVMRHLAQQGVAPPFYPFEVRDEHDLDGIAAGMIERKLDRMAEDAALRTEYVRADRLWDLLFRDYHFFKNQYNLTVERLMAKPEELAEALERLKEHETTPTEVDEATKKAVKERDGHRCLCCGATSDLQVDHVEARYHGGADDGSNLQTLCAYCNRVKGIMTMDFRPGSTVSQLDRAPDAILPAECPAPGRARDIDVWRRFVRQQVNLHYRCGAVAGLAITTRGYNFHTWVVELHPGNDPAWLQPFLRDLLSQVREVKRTAGFGAPKELIVRSAGKPSARVVIGI